MTASDRKRWSRGLLAAGLLALASLEPARGQQLSEAAGWLQQYLRIDTTNPPGNEHLAASFLARILHREGIGTQLLVTPDGRTSLYARLRAAEPKAGPLVLSHHLDVVPPGPGWTVEPFAGEVARERLWGRGAIDSKGLGVAHLAAFLALARRGTPLARDVIFLAVADEETGGVGGTRWILEQHPELFADVEAVLGEGGMNRVLRGRPRWWGIEVAQKRPLWLELRAHGRGGHAASLNLHTAPHRLVRALDALLKRPLRYRVTPEARAFLEAVDAIESPDGPGPDLDSLFQDGAPTRPLPPGLPSYFLDSLQVTVLEAGSEINITPEEAVARVDARLLPDTDAERLLAEIREAAGPEVSVKVLLEAPNVEPSPTSAPLYRCLAEALGSEAPTVPAFIPGITDSRYFREQGVPAYGFSPFLLEGEDLRGIHGPDEGISLAAFDDGVERMTRLVVACATRQRSLDGSRP